MRKEEFFDISLAELGLGDLQSGITLDDIIYVEELKQRKLFLNLPISQITVDDIVRNIMKFNAEDKGIAPEERKPILLYLVSPGGEVDSGFELIDAILSSKTPVYTINLGYQYSMAFLIGIAGHKRFAFRNATFLMHDGSEMLCDSGTKVRDRMEFNRRVEERTRAYVLERTNITSEEYDMNLRVEWYMFADEAKERGVVNYIIGEDCELDDII